MDFTQLQFNKIYTSEVIDGYGLKTSSIFLHKYENRQYIVYYVTINNIEYIEVVRINPDYDISLGSLNLSKDTNIMELFDDLADLNIIDMNIISRYTIPHKFINLIGKIEVKM